MALLIVLGGSVWAVQAGAPQIALARLTLVRPPAAARDGVYRPLVGRAGPASALAGVAAEDYTFSKTVMLQSVFDANGGSCAPSVDTLTVDYGEVVVYCYIYTNIGSTTFITVSMTDDKLGVFGPIPFGRPLAPAHKDGFVAYGVTMTQTTTNTGISILIDEFGASVERSDSATVNVIVPSTPTVTPTGVPAQTPTVTPTATLTWIPAHRLWLPMVVRSETGVQEINRIR